MEKLVKARPYILATFFLALLTFGVGAFNQAMGVLRAGGILAHLALFLFVLTESFGSLSKQRTRFSRNMARVFLVFSGFVVAGIIANIFMLGLSKI